MTLSRSACYGTCPAYEVTISEDGNVAWNGRLFVKSIGTRNAKIDPETARLLIRRFLDPKFWTLCAHYSAAITDNPTTTTSVQIGARSKLVSNYARSAPQVLETLEEAIDAAADTHRWRHGDPRTESIGNIVYDAGFPKPGLTPLMRASAKADVNSMKQIIAAGENVDIIDSSGWTALMYAAANYSSSSDPVQLLLKAGANPNHRSFCGDTPLMAAAAGRAFDEDLWRAGADVNAKDSQGTTPLMILSTGGEADEVEDALAAGADPLAKDVKGRSALDYLRLANCGKNPITELQFLETGTQCDNLDKDEVRKIAKLLRSRHRTPKY